jgi:hypothetical protein
MAKEFNTLLIEKLRNELLQYLLQIAFRCKSVT